MKIINPKVNDDINSGSPIKLHIGSGNSNLDGYYNLDIADLPNVDIVADLNELLTEIPDNSVSAIYARHSLEHIRNIIGLIKEFHRICRHGAEIKIIVPHFSNPYYYSDPTHVQPFGLYTLHYFMDTEEQEGRKVPSYYTNARFSPGKCKIEFYKTSLLDKILVPIIRTLTNINYITQFSYERRWVWLWPASDIKFVIYAKKQ